MTQDFSASQISLLRMTATSIVAKSVTVTEEFTSGTTLLVTADSSTTLTNKTIDSADNTFTIDGTEVSGDLAVDSLTASGTVSGSNISTSEQVDLSSAQTIINKTLSVTLNSGGAFTLDSATVLGAVSASSLRTDSLKTTADSLLIGARHQRFESTHSFTLGSAMSWGLSEPLAAHYLGRFEPGQHVHLHIATSLTAKSVNVILHVQNSTLHITDMTCSDLGTNGSDIRVYSRLSGTASDIWLDYYHDTTAEVVCYVVGDCYSVDGISHSLPGTDPQDGSQLVSEGSDWVSTITHFSNNSDVSAVNYDVSLNTPIVGHNVFSDLNIDGNFTVSGSTNITDSAVETYTNKTIDTANNTISVAGDDVVGNLDNITSVVATDTLTTGAVVHDPDQSVQGMIVFDTGIGGAQVSLSVLTSTQPVVKFPNSNHFDVSVNCTIIGNSITFSIPGTYNISFSASTFNGSGVLHGVGLFKNGAGASNADDRIPGSSVYLHGEGQSSASSSVFVDISDTDYVDLGMWTTSSTATIYVRSYNITAERMRTTL